VAGNTAETAYLTRRRDQLRQHPPIPIETPGKALADIEVSWPVHSATYRASDGALASSELAVQRQQKVMRLFP
jgi:hypothetical protein